jgi:tripartite-type tricarboxylate transporter receptor subunit TctC
MNARRKLLTGVAAAVLSASVFAQGAGGYPNRPIRMIVPYAPGGVSDIMGRALAQKMTELLGQAIVVENRGGAGGTLGTDMTAKSAPDGYTITLSSLTAYAVAPNMLKTVTYNPVKDFTALGGVAIAPNILSVGSSAPFHTLKDIIAYAKANPDKLTFGSSGVGSIGHLSGEVLRTTTGAGLLHIPYKSAGAAYPDMFAGNVSMVFDTLPSAIQHIRYGKARAIAVLSDKRSALLPDVPTFAEAGFPEATLRFWFGLHAPANLPGSITQKLNEVLNQALAAQDLRERFAALGADPFPTTPQQLSDLVRADMEKLAQTVKAAHIQRE